MKRGRMPLGSLVQTHDHVLVAVCEWRLSAVVAPRTSAVPVRLCPVVELLASCGGLGVRISAVPVRLSPVVDSRISAVPVRLSPAVVHLASCGGLGVRISAVPVRLSSVVVV